MQPTSEIAEIKQDAKQFPILPEKILSPVIYSDIGDWRVRAKGKIKEIIDKFKPLKQDAAKAHKNLVRLEEEVREPFEAFVAQADIILGDYTIEQERIRVEKERVLAEKAKKEAEDLQIKEAEQADTPEEAEAILAEEIHVPPPQVQSAVPKIPGLSNVTNWKFKIINEKLIPREYLMPDEQKIGKIVRAMKNKTNIPGIQAYSDTKMKGVRQ